VECGCGKNTKKDKLIIFHSPLLPRDCIAWYSLTHHPHAIQLRGSKVKAVDRAVGIFYSEK